MLAWSRMFPVSFWVGVAPLFGGLPEEGDVEQVGFAGIGDCGLCFGYFSRDQLGFDRIGVDAVIYFRQGAVEIPRE